jgi:hypothetical protein
VWDPPTASARELFEITAQRNFNTTSIPLERYSTTHDNMPPKKKVERPAQENISLGPQVREGQFRTILFPAPYRSVPSLRTPTSTLLRIQLTARR